MGLQLSKKVSNAIYGYGAAVVIIGALMKITYFSPTWWPSAANTMLTIGLVLEALIFAYSAIDPSLAKEDYEWERVYPILAGKKGKGGAQDTTSPQELMSKNIEEMFRKYKLDENVVKGLSQSIRDFESSAKSGADSASELAKINKEFANNANELTKQMAALSSNLETLNNVYGGVLNAMNRK